MNPSEIANYTKMGGAARAAAGDKDLSKAAHRVLLAYASYLNLNSGEAWPSKVLLSRETNLDGRTVRRAIASLVKKGYLVRLKNTRGGRGQTAVFGFGKLDKDQHPAQKKGLGNPGSANTAAPPKVGSGGVDNAGSGRPPEQNAKERSDSEDQPNSAGDDQSLGVTGFGVNGKIKVQLTRKR
ncbi:MAG: helix-turn-helix domain-containing protein [Pseudomonadota bacterium]